jgi:hypothetical protein
MRAGQVDVSHFVLKRERRIYTEVTTDNYGNYLCDEVLI